MEDKLPPFWQVTLYFFWHNLFVIYTEKCRPAQYLSGDDASSVVHVFEQVCSGFKWITAHYPQLLFRISWEIEKKPDMVFC